MRPARLLSQLAHVELLTPKVDESVQFLVDVLGLEESDRDERSVYLRGWGEWLHHSVQVSEAERPGLGHVAWRAAGEVELEAAVERLEAGGCGEGWHAGERGRGPAYRYRGPGGHLHEVFWEVERYQAPPELRSPFPNRPQRYVPRGAAVRQLDHVTLMSVDVMADVAWHRDTLGHRFMEWTELDDDSDLVVFATLTTNEKGHDLGLIADRSSLPGRLHHLAFWVDSREDVLHAADVLLNAGTAIEFGPGRHGMGEQEYLYFREPGGLRLEVNSGGYRDYQPD
jgi:catechol 2,3-dioxygenase